MSIKEISKPDSRFVLKNIKHEKIETNFGEI
jgi:hypothetical protein